MALHRDIFWVGRQWAVTGYGVQAVDQRLKGVFDIEIARLWDDDLLQRMGALAWLKAEDFENALKVARSRFPEPPGRKNLPLVESVLELIAPIAREPQKPEVKPRLAEIEAAPPLPPSKAVIAPVDAVLSSEPPKQEVKQEAEQEAKPSLAEFDVALSLRRLLEAVTAPIEAPPLPSEPPKGPTATPITAPTAVSLMMGETKPAEIEPLASERPPAQPRLMELRIEHVSAKFLPRWRIRH